MKRKQKTASPCITSPPQPSRYAAAKVKKAKILFKDRSIISEAIIRARNNEGLPDKENQLMRFDEFNRKLMFYGAPEVIIAFNEWRVANLAAQDDVISDHLAPIGKILLAMRKDIGLSNKGLGAMAIQQVTISDDLKRHLKP